MSGGCAMCGANLAGKDVRAALPTLLMRSPTCSKSVDVLVRLPIITFQLHLLGRIRRLFDGVSTVVFEAVLLH